MKPKSQTIVILALVLIIFSGRSLIQAQKLNDNPVLDEKVKAFFNNHPSWQDMNVPVSDGQLLYNIILEHNYQRALEIGTSTGHSAIWMAWALSKTGGKLLTIEINEGRYKEALENFKTAGLEQYIDARLADAHELVPELEGPFDFVFSDADKYWYKNYFTAIDPKLSEGGCYTTHNVTSRRGYGRNSDYLNFLFQQKNYVTTVNDDGGGVAISYKKTKP